MSTYEVISMKYNSREQIADITLLEQQCKQLDSIYLKADIDHISKKDGDHALLCYSDDSLVGLLSWYPSDDATGNINAIVHPHKRRLGVFSRLLKHAVADMRTQGINQLSYRIPQGSPSGLKTAQSLGAVHDRSEYSMQLVNGSLTVVEPSDLILSVAEAKDFEFMVTCSAQAFGDSEEWTRNYFTQTDEPSRVTYIAWKNELPVGLVRINVINKTTAFIHNFCILPAYQGKRLGRTVLGALVKLLMKQHYTVIRLSVVTDNDRALNLYQSVGFEVHSEYQYFSGNL
ncbi:GNAT family N-acetyltransferase [Paenibacillus pabuli]|uniref:GNAT family N-acetyltransferase n=1 Tax=Paenibacillus pabuli TaxID=1472 RepID=UPI0007813DAF|nr:GNAT family N-acetyltransferase [Paenibacillus pabuli]MEC0123228.1 GNAT family N-acetyltransferase [Paenibacillus pabuli]